MIDDAYIEEQVLYSILNAKAEGATISPMDTMRVYPHPESDEEDMITVMVMDYLKEYNDNQANS